MAQSSSRRRRRSESAEDVSELVSPASDTSKRRRRNDGNAPNGDTPSRAGASRTNGTNGTTGQIDMNAFHAGAIVRVTVENFVTYEKAEFFPGPYLNMVIGPNGTGKSSLVCAICLGLGYSPKHLGRAGSVKEFVKHGKDNATIEIELQKRPSDRRNYIVKVQIRREQNSQKWWLNGKETTHKAIQELMRTLKIQVDNLCQFLPQDRVVEFAACTPVDLLHETLRAAAPEEMLMWQSQLQELHKAKKEIVEGTRSDAEQLENLETRQQGLQADVDRLLERQQIQDKVEDLKAALVLSRYQEARDKHAAAKQKKKDAERSLKKLEQDSGPSLNAVNDKQEYSAKISKAIKAQETVLEQCHVKTRAAYREALAQGERIKEFGNRLDAERKGFEAKRRDFAASRSKITQLQGDLKNRPEPFNAADWNQKIRSEEHTLRELEESAREVNSSFQAIVAQGSEIKHKTQQLMADMQALDTQQGQQLNLMKRNFPDVAKAWEWIQDNKGEFEKEVFGPPMICCSVKNDRYADAIQAMLQVDDYLCFTAQTKADYKKLSDQIYRVMSLSVNIRTCSVPLSSFKPPATQAQLADIGLDGFAVDFLDGPEPVLAMLCAEKRLHLSGISMMDHSEEQYERLVNSERISQWAAGRQLYTVRRRKEYGPKAMTTVTKSIMAGKFWTSQPVDVQEKTRIQNEIVDLQRRKEPLKAEHEKLKEKKADIEHEKDAINEKIESLKAEKSALQKESQRWQSLPQKIENEERQKAASEEAMREARATLTEIQYEWDSETLKRVKLALRHKRSIERVRAAHQTLIEYRLCLVEANSDVAGLKELNAALVEQLEKEREKLDIASREATESRDAGRLISDELKEVLLRAPDKQDMYSELCEGKSPEEMRNLIDAEKAQLELIHAANPNVMRDFNKRAEEIAKIKAKMEKAGGEMSELNVKLQSLMGKWEPKLDELVAQINDAFAYNFEQISCAGEVRVDKADNFDNWALDIMVRFRYVLPFSSSIEANTCS
ncbi:hypothetical protein VHEMI07805 [[Torrubiella] hemipterigena]|uniref:Structural maintenance of chromosomes protein 5 n=1 Tax=[Torrubiella] hemipterigena TaxID=1531966 RepID=A0A0A1T4P5_9HYPO|nr:hypothetical protein VHEMI07805 [[Torrubiella] hemipterigena]